MICWCMRRRNEEKSKAAAVAACRLHWEVAERCDHDVVKALALRHDLDAVCCVDYVSLFTDFFEYLQRIGVWKRVAALVPEGKQRFIIETLPYVMIYMQKLIAGLPSMNAAEEVLLTDEAAMRVVGFNAHQIKDGISMRGRHRRKDGGPPGRPVAADTLGENVSAIGMEAVTDLFNHAVQMLAAQGVFPKEVTVALDPTDIETPKGFGGAGSVTRKRKLLDKRGRLTTVEVTVWGFRLIVVMETKTRIPVAAKLVQIQENGVKYWKEMITQAHKNLEGHAKIKTVVADREFVDGEIMWWVNEQGMGFVIPGKSNMDVTCEARQRMRQACEGTFADGTTRRERMVQVKRGQGKEQWVETLATVVWGIEGLAGLDTYGPSAECAKKHRKNARGHALNAVVVDTWNNKQARENEEVVFLTNLPVKNALRVYDLYDERSLIETPLNKEAKQNWHLSKPPQRTEHALHNHAFMVLMLMGLTRAYRQYQANLEADPHEKNPAADPLGFRRWRRQIERENADKVIVFVDGKFAVLHLAEFTVLVSDIRIRGSTTRDMVLAKYGVTL